MYQLEKDPALLYPYGLDGGVKIDINSITNYSQILWILERRPGEDIHPEAEVTSKLIHRYPLSKQTGSRGKIPGRGQSIFKRL